MWICTICGARWRGQPSACPLDGGALDPLPDPLIGRVLAGRYVIDEKIGEGGMGTVYRGRHDVVNRDVAVKFLSPRLADDATNRTRFLREAQAANRIDHEHIIDITDYGETEDGLVYLVMEFLDGRPLSELIEQGPMPAYRAVDIAAQMAAALARAHELDVIHRDIKPDNVFILTRSDGGDFVKLLDFGLAKMKGELRLTVTGAVFGTPEYMAPEQARGAPITEKADLYALGCVIYEMLLGEPPFLGATADLILRHMQAIPESLSERGLRVLPALEALVMRLLEKDPSARHVDAHHVLEDLRLIADEVPRPKHMATLRDVDFRAELAAAKAASVSEVRPESAGLGDWGPRLMAFAGWGATAYPRGAPTWLVEAISSMQADHERLSSRHAELSRVTSSSMRQEEELREARLRLGQAIDILGQDESRALRQIEELRLRAHEATERLAVLEAPLRQRWNALPTPGEGAIDERQVDALRDLGQLASVWLEGQRAVTQSKRELERREGERDDLRFQIAQLKGRLGTLSAEGELELERLKEKARALDEEREEIRERLAARAARLVEHFEGFPEIAAEVRASARR